MSTLGDVFKKIASVETRMSLFGATEEFQKEYHKQTKRIASAVCEEKNVSSELAMDLSEETPLGEKSQKLFNEFSEWLEMQ